MQPIFERTHILLKKQGLNIIQRSHVLIAGLGGVNTTLLGYEVGAIDQ